MRRGGLLEIVEVDVAVVVALHHHDAHAGHRRARGVRTVGRCGDQADRAPLVSPAPVIGADREQPRELTLRTRVRLQRHRVVSGDRTQPSFEIREQLPVPGGLIERCERMDPPELRPGDRNHLRGRVQLHRARAERDHRPVEREVLVGEPPEVAEHLGLGVMPVEHRMRKDLRRPGQADRDPDAGTRVPLPCRDPECRRDVVEHRRGGRLVERDRDGVGVDQAEVHATRPRRGHDLVGPPRHPHPDRVEERLPHHLDATRAQRGHERRRQPLHPVRDRPEPVRAVVRRVQAGDDREQDLRGADVARRLLSADVLLTGLQREPHRPATFAVDRHADESTGQAALVLVAGGEERGVRTAVSERHTEALRRTDDHIGAHLARWLTQHQGEQITRDRDERAAGLGSRDRRREVAHDPAAPGILEQHPEDAGSREVVGQVDVRVADDHLDPDRLGPGCDHLDGLRMRVGVDEEHAAGLRVEPMTQRHRLGGRGPFVEERGVRDVHAGEIAHHGLEVQECFQAALRDLRLVRRVRGVPGRVLEHVAQDHRWRDRVGVPETDQRPKDLVLVRERPDGVERLDLVECSGKIERAPRADRFRYHLIDEIGGGRKTERVEHRLLLVGFGPDVAAREASRRGDESVGARVLRTFEGHGTSGISATGDGCIPTLSRYLRDSRPRLARRGRFPRR